MLNSQDGEQMYDRYEEEEENSSEKKESDYHIFDIRTVKDTYLSNKFKTEEHNLKSEVIKQERVRRPGEVIFKNKSFFERLGPQFMHMPIQSKS